MLQTPKDIEERAAQFDQNATRVQVGTYVENLKEVNLKTSSFRMVVLIWFKWEGNDNLDMAKHFRIYKGTINKTEVVKNYHENGVNYQAVRYQKLLEPPFPVGIPSAPHVCGIRAASG